ncbi:MAG: helix-turn-helix transcriptional regulator [Firmicutes bacterium]|nr:helix-turn-helix transcriptional regulator [Bacillota bacterium]
MEKLNKSARQVSLETGNKVSAAYISKILHNERKPSPKVLKLLASPLQLPYDVLLREAGFLPS